MFIHNCNSLWESQRVLVSLPLSALNKQTLFPIRNSGSTLIPTSTKRHSSPSHRLSVFFSLTPGPNLCHFHEIGSTPFHPSFHPTDNSVALTALIQNGQHLTIITHGQPHCHQNLSDLDAASLLFNLTSQ